MEPEVQDKDAARLEMFRAVAALEHAALRPLLLLNGGAAVALLAFLGSIWSASKGTEFAKAKVLTTAAAVAGSMNYFIWGLAFAVLAYFAAYMSQHTSVRLKIE